jgi:UrcA family protein
MERSAISAAAATAALAFSFATTAVLAIPAGREVTTVQVDYGDLDLGSADGAATLYRRIQSAARTACGERRLLPLYLRAADAACVRDAISAAVARVDQATLTALHRERTASRKA